MIKNYLKVAFRNLVRNKAHTFINMAGLSIGLACSLLILLWVQYELSIDAWHKNGSRIYQVYERQYYDHKVEGIYGTPGLMAMEMKKVIPEVEYAVTTEYDQWNTFKVGDKVLSLSGTYAGADYFKMFGNTLLQGNPQTSLNMLSSIAISHKMADQFFGSPQAAMGKSILYENKKSFIVTAVFEDLPKNTDRKFEYLINWNAALEEFPWFKQWDNQGPETYILLRADANPKLVEHKITHFMDNYNKEQKKGTFSIELGMQRFDAVFLHGTFVNGKIEGGRIEYVRLFSLIAIFILLIACINFMNLTTARSINRAREIGVRKVIGAVRSVLIKQFIGESMLITVIAVLIALFLVSLLLPIFNQVTLKQIDLPFNQISFWLKLLGITLITGFVSGSYPALFLSSFNPVNVLKGTLKIGGGASVFRKGLVIFQFVLSITLIIGTIVISRQVNYIQSKNLGFDRENLIYLPLNGDLNTKYGTFKSEALRMPGIESITRTDNTPTDIENGASNVQWIGMDPNVNIQFTNASAGYDYVSTMKLKLLAGRDFSKAFPTDSVGYLINETALKRLGYANPIGQPLTFWGKKGKIIGLLKDFHFASMHDAINPLIIRFGEQDRFGSALIRTLPGQTKQAITSLETLCKQLNPNFQFNYTFADDEYKNLYQAEQVIGNLSNAFAFLAIFISCLGLLGLAMFTAEQRFKEIGIRKVLGASAVSLFTLLSSEFLILVFIALVIASPIAWYVMNIWLQSFAYHTPLQLWMIALAGGLIILIALATISFQAIKAALINPIKSLRSE